MTFQQIFDDQVYTCTPFHMGGWRLPPNYMRNRGNLIDTRPSVRPEILTPDWVADEIAKAFSRDLRDPFYENESYMEGLYDSASPNEFMLLVFNADDYLVGKIGFHEVPSALTLNVMMLYVFGDRRRSFEHVHSLLRKNISGAYIIWYFAALYATERFGRIARLLMTYPRDIVFKQLYRAGATFVELEQTFDMIRSHIRNFSFRYHDLYIEHQLNPTNRERMDFHVGALFSCRELMERIDEFEELVASRRS